MTSPDMINAVSDGPLAATVTAYLDRGVDWNDPAVTALRAEARRFLRPGMAVGEVSRNDDGAVLAFSLGPDHLEEPLEDILAWLRDQRVIRVIEIERYAYER